MNTLKMILHAFDAVGRDPRSLRRFAALLHCETMQDAVKGFHASKKFFNHTLDA
jgi:hypothetical protein